ncbi:MAG: hypothetical protein MMC23_000161 [Stictis urceolatum]|nr:hypothetical protein [Stictis urceolata]
MAQCSIHSEMFAKDTEMPLQSQDDGKAAAWTSAAAVSQNSLPLPVDADKRSSQSLSRTEVGELQLTSATDFTPSAHIGDLTEKQAVPDGGLRAWLQVLSAFCIWFNTWHHLLDIPAADQRDGSRSELRLIDFGARRGLLSSYGVYQTYYQSINLGTESDISWIGSVQGALLLCGSAVTGYLYDMGFLRHMLYVGHAILVTGMMLTSIATTYWQVFLAQGVLIGSGASLLFLPCISNLQQYFCRKKGLATGMASSGNAFGGVLFPLLFRSLNARVGPAWTTRTMAFVILVFSLPPLLTMRSLTICVQPRHLPHPSSLPRDRGFQALCFSVAFIYAGSYAPYFYLPTYAVTELHLPSSLGFYLIAFANASSLIGRIVPAALGDRLGMLNMHLAAGLSTVIFAFSWIAVRDERGLIAFSVLYGVTSGAFLSLAWPLVVVLTQDKKTVGARLG